MVVFLLRVSCDAGIDLDQLEYSWAQYPQLKMERDYSDDLTKQHFIFIGAPSVELLKMITQQLIPHRGDFLEHEINWQPGLRGLMQFFVLAEIAEKLKGSNL